MEEGFYEVDVNTLKAKELYKDSNEAWRLYRKDPKNTPKPVELLRERMVKDCIQDKE